MTDPNDQHPEDESFFPQDDLADSVQEMHDHFERVDAFLEEFNNIWHSDDQSTRTDTH
jgi:hypothetical protein